MRLPQWSVSSLMFLQKWDAPHWNIENQLHWVLDVQFSEDDSRIRKDNAPQNLSLIRQVALNLLNQDKSIKAGIKTNRKRAGWDNSYLLKVLAN